MRKPSFIPVLALQVVATLLTGCVTREPTARDVSQKLQTITINTYKLSGSPREVVKQLNKLSKKYDFPQREGVRIIFDPDVDPDNCEITIFREGEPLARWLQSVCSSCGSTYRISENKVVIELLPISDKQTADLEMILPEGMIEACREFRSRRGKDRFDLGEKIFQLLPSSPEKWKQEVPMHRFVSYDYEHPSYKLHKRDIFMLLGEPDHNVNNQTFRYSLRKHGEATLSVDFGKYDHVINPLLTY